MKMPITMLNGCDCEAIHWKGMRSLKGLAADPVELNNQTYRTRTRISSYQLPTLLNKSMTVLRTYEPGAVVGKFLEAKTIDNKLYFRSSYGGWLPYSYDNFYFANLPDAKLTDEQKLDIVIRSSNTPGAKPVADVVKTGGQLVQNTAEGALDLASFVGDVAKNMKWIVIAGVAAVGGYYAYKFYKSNK